MVPPATGLAPAARPATGLAARLAARGERPALLTAGASLSYAALATRVDEVAAALGPVRRLVQVRARNDVDALVSYLGALAGGHAVLLVPADGPAPAALRGAWDPDVVLDGPDLQEVRPGTRHALHPDLALLLSTSGSTGSPKLVRLSRANLLENARSIVQALGVRPDDRALTALPLQYCYGLSVVHSHLLAGASLVLTDESVTAPAFWDLARRTAATTLPGVPHTFELLERAGLDGMLERGELPALRVLTQAGGRMAPERVRTWAELGAARGFDLHVMYGATEATARMAVLPADLARTRPQAVGRPVPGGAFRLAPVDGLADGVGELVYSGPNVMMGYAQAPEDLARGPELAELRTGDLARQAPDGLWEVVGRRSRLAKPFGVRVDLDHVEQVLDRAGRPAWCLDGGAQLLLAVEGDPAPRDRRALRLAAAGACGLPPRAVRVLALPVLPRTPSGKPDREAVRALATAAPGPAAPSADGVHALLAEVLEVPRVRDEDTFVGLGGDSLSYVEASVRLEQLLGDLPPDWQHRRVGELAASAAPAARAVPSGRRRAALAGLLRPVRADLPLVLRGLAIVLVVASHADLFEVLGGAHLLLAVAGYNLARFQGSLPSGRSGAVLRSVGRVVAPSVVWVAGAALLLDWYPWTSALLLNWLVGPEELGRPWELWFLEALVLALAGVGVLLAVPAVDRLERRAPFGCALAALSLALVVREVVRLQPGAVRVYGVLAVGWLVALGWAAARAPGVRERVLLSAVAVVAVPPFFAEAPRGAVVVAGVLALLWLRTVRLPAAAVRGLSVLAAGSLYVYLAHWQVFPQLELRSPLLAVLASFAVGLAFQQAWERGRRAVGRRWHSDVEHTRGGALPAP